ncbi:DUF4401 domain-containing protein [Pedobacter duraquae]|uniref:Uncharacterized protein DUF4401 n=1 Tax=Pedobacter duraquae TaxID=425511 RepID=A0A4R6IBG5_9SPHI|nr:DUF4401 domain-containing protein [Pedobacter duraquae]TDO19543.1 uncharacterized protein DUF4401 [Pedobacter duraquae]
MESVHKESLGIKLLSISGGILASMFFIGFLFMTVFDSPKVMGFLGLFILAGTLVVDRTSTSRVLDGACIGATLAAITMIGAGLGNTTKSDNITTLFLLGFAIIIPMFSRGYMLNLIAVLLFNGCLFALITINKQFSLVHLLAPLLAAAYTYTSLYKFRIWRIGFLISFIALLGFLGIESFNKPGYVGFEWLSSILIMVVAAFILNHIIRTLQIESQQSKVLIYAMTLLLMLLSAFAPAICGGLLILLLSFHTNHRFGLIIGFIALIYFVGQYYYNLHFSLLIKSAIMVATGVLFLTAWFIFKNTLKRYEQN